MVTTHPLEKAIALRGLNRLARDVGLTHQALRRWQRQGRLPRTEWTGETAYAEKIAKAVDGIVSVAELRSAWPKWPSVASSANAEGKSVPAGEGDVVRSHDSSFPSSGDGGHARIEGRRI